jgi:ribonucleotide reductase alpha subunit
MKRRAGVGMDISNIRPKGLNVKNAAKTTDGIAVFMERFSNTTREVAQNGRRGALMLTISSNYLEIETFIDIKKDLSKVTGANISVRITDDFMEAVETNGKWQRVDAARMTLYVSRFTLHASRAPSSTCLLVYSPPSSFSNISPSRCRPRPTSS